MFSAGGLSLLFYLAQSFFEMAATCISVNKKKTQRSWPCSAENLRICCQLRKRDFSSGSGAKLWRPELDVLEALAEQKPDLKPLFMLLVDFEFDPNSSHINKWPKPTLIFGSTFKLHLREVKLRPCCIWSRPSWLLTFYCWSERRFQPPPLSSGSKSPPLKSLWFYSTLGFTLE